MKKKKVVSMVMAVLLTVLSISLAGCGKSKKEGGNTNSSEQVEITVCDASIAITGETKWRALRQKEFEKNYSQIKVKHISPIAGDTTNMVEYLTTIFAGDNAPAYYDVSSISYIRDLYNSDLAADISPYLGENSSLSKAYDFVQKAVKYNNAIIAWPTSIEVPLMGFYSDLLTNAGYDPETFTCETWEDYYEMAGKLTTEGVAGASLYTYDYFLWPANYFLSNSAEPAVQNKDGTISLDFTSKEFIETLEFFKKLYKAGYTNSNITYAQMSEMLTLLENKKVASFTFYPNWKSMFENYGVDTNQIVVRQFPKGPSFSKDKPATNVVISGAVFNSRLEEAELKAALTYYEFMNGEEAQQDLLQFKIDNKIEGFDISVFPTVDWKKGLKGLDIPQSWITETDISLKEAYVTPLHSTAFTTYLTVQFGDVVRGKKDAKDAMKSAQTMAENEWLKNFNEYLK